MQCIAENCTIKFCLYKINKFDDAWNLLRRICCCCNPFDVCLLIFIHYRFISSIILLSSLYNLSHDVRRREICFLFTRTVLSPSSPNRSHIAIIQIQISRRWNAIILSHIVRALKHKNWYGSQRINGISDTKCILLNVCASLYSRKIAIRCRDVLVVIRPL